MASWTLSFCFGDAEIDLALLALDLADDFLSWRLRGGRFSTVKLGVGEVALVLFGGDVGLGEGLIEGGLAWRRAASFCSSCCSEALESKRDDGFALLHGLPGGASQAMRRLGNDGRVDLERSAGVAARRGSGR